MDPLQVLQEEVVACRKCPRLVAHRERVAREKVRRYREEEYWGKPIPGFGDRRAHLLVIGLAPAAHGGNRTGRIFTGDRSGDFLYAALCRAGFANQPWSRHRGDGLTLRDCYITAAVRCAPPGNKPTPQELATCQSYLIQEIRLHRRARVVVALGRIAFEAFLKAWVQAGRSMPLPRPRFAHRAMAELPGGVRLLASYHPSQQNTQTGRLTAGMFRRIFSKAKQVLTAVASNRARQRTRRRG